MIWIGKTRKEKLENALNYAEWLVAKVADNLRIEEKVSDGEEFEAVIEGIGDEELERMYDLYKRIKDLCEPTSLYKRVRAWYRQLLFSDLEEVEEILEEIEEKIEEMEKISDEIIKKYGVKLW